MNRSRILMVDRDPVTRGYIKSNSGAGDFEVISAGDAVEALKLFEKERPDLVLIDLALPNMDSLALCRRLRVSSSVPIIMLGYRRDEASVVSCFKAGADDYINKPFGMEELSVRIRAVLRRSVVPEVIPVRSDFAMGDIRIKFDEQRVTLCDQDIKLTPTEFKLLQELALNADKVLTHDVLLRRVWGPEYEDDRHNLRVVIDRLRKKLKDDEQKPGFIVTVPWVGYKLKASNDNGSRQYS